VNKKRLNILQVVGITHRGGSGASAAFLSKKLYERGHNVICVCNRNSFGFELLTSIGVPTVTSVVMSNKFKPNIKFFKQYINDVLTIKDLIEKNDIDILHTHCSPEYWIGALARALVRKKPAFIRTRHIPVPVKKNLLNTYLFNSTDRVIAVSSIIRENYFDKNGYDKKKIETIYDGVDCKRFHPQVDGKVVRKEFNIKDDEILIGNIARLDTIKGHNFFLQSIGEVVREAHNVKVIIAGWRDKKFKDEDMDKLKRIIMDMGIEDKIIFTGFKDNIENILAAIDIFVLSSVGSEGSSRATLEAIAMAKPCVATKVGILPELIEEGKSGFLVPSREPHLMAEAILKLIRNPDRAREFGNCAYKRFLENFTNEIMVEKTLMLYYKVLREKET